MGRAELRVRVATTVTTALALAVAAGCTGAPPDEPTPDRESVALDITTVPVPGAARMTGEERADAESEVADVLTGYLVGGFLGDYPRGSFVDSFDAFTGGLTRTAARDIEQLTAVRAADASAVRATRLDTRLSFVTLPGQVVGASAGVDFAFEATVDGEVRRLTLDGRLMLVQEEGVWRIFGYDLRSDDGLRVQAGVAG